jgi:outer membrane protein assembly factor BamB
MRFAVMMQSRCRLLRTRIDVVQPGRRFRRALSCAMIPSTLCFAIALQLPCNAPAGDWSSFRGSNGDGIALGEKPVQLWGPSQNVAWRVQLTGSGNGSPIVIGHRVLLNCAKDLGRRRTLHCYDAADGRDLWSRSVAIDVAELTHKSNPYCGTTPVSNGEVVVVWHGTAGLHCYTLEGKQVWSRDLGEIRHLWGYGTSPIIYKDRVILNSGANSTNFVMAVRVADGATIWKTEEPGGQSNETPDGVMTGSWCTPVLAHAVDQDIVVCGMPTRIVAYDPDDGQILWSCGGLTGSNGNVVYASPVIGSGIAVVMAGYKGPTVGVRLGGAGDLTETHRIWQSTTSNPQRIGSGVIVGQSIYVANADGGTIQCLDLATGQERWRARVRGGPHWASTVLAGGMLYATNQTGTTRVFRPNPNRFELVAENNLDELINATPAFSDNKVFIRTVKHLYCISERDGTR